MSDNFSSNPVFKDPVLKSTDTRNPIVLSKDEYQRFNDMEVLPVESLCMDILKMKQYALDKAKNDRCKWSKLEKEIMKEDKSCDDMTFQSEIFSEYKLNREEDVKYMKRLAEIVKNKKKHEDQMSQKKLIEQELKLLDMTQNEDNLAEKLTDEKAIALRKKMEYMKGLVAQINENRLKKLEEAYIEHMEGVKMRHEFEKRTEEDWKNHKKKLEEIRKLRDELDKMLNDSKKKKISEKEADKLIEEKIEEALKEAREKDDVTNINRNNAIKKQEEIANYLGKKQLEMLKKKQKLEERRIELSIVQKEKERKEKMRREKCKEEENLRLLKEGWKKQMDYKKRLVAERGFDDKMHQEASIRDAIKEFKEVKIDEKLKKLKLGKVLKTQMREMEERRKTVFAENIIDSQRKALENKYKDKAIEKTFDRVIQDLRNQGVSENDIEWAKKKYNRREQERFSMRFTDTSNYLIRLMLKMRQKEGEKKNS